MTVLQERFRDSPIYARVAPFVIFLVLTAAQDMFGEAGRYYFYLAKTLAGGWLVWAMWPYVSEMRWVFGWEAVAVGVGVCVMWVGIDGLYPKAELTGKPWNPHLQFGENSVLAWFFILVRTAGSTIVVPPLEEVFYRSFLYRWFVRLDFQSMPLSQFHGLSFVVTTAIFTATHHHWLAAILCGFAYQGLVLYKGRLGDVIVAHALTNFLLSIWVVWKGDWSFW